MASSRLERIGTIFSRELHNSNLHKNIMGIESKLKEDYQAMKQNQLKLQELTSITLKCMNQSTQAYKEKMAALEKLRTSMNEEVEGLLARGAMKPDDRPVWFDVYRAFPPLVEPTFARPKPEIKPIRQIFYKEDVIRAEFHSKGHGLGAVNMLAQNNETQTKRLVQQYEKLKAEGVAEEDLIEKSATAVGIERKEQYEASKKVAPENPNSVTAQVLSEVNLKPNLTNIFKE